MVANSSRECWEQSWRDKKLELIVWLEKTQRDPLAASWYGHCGLCGLCGHLTACQPWDLNRTNRELEEPKNEQNEMKWNSDCQMSDCWLPNQLFSSRVPGVLRILIFLFTGMISCSFSARKQKTKAQARARQSRAASELQFLVVPCSNKKEELEGILYRSPRILRFH